MTEDNDSSTSSASRVLGEAETFLFVLQCTSSSGTGSTSATNATVATGSTSSTGPNTSRMASP